jgi:hypothetical protein
MRKIFMSFVPFVVHRFSWSITKLNHSQGAREQNRIETTLTIVSDHGTNSL